MSKKTYYVNVDIGPHAGEIREYLDQNDAYYDFEIMATPEEITHLQLLFEEAQDTDFRTFVKANIPFQTLNREKESWVEDDEISKIYHLIYELGTQETRAKMDKAGILH